MHRHLRTLPTPPDGALIALFVGASGDIVLRVEISEGTSNVDELFLRHLVMLTADVGVPEVAFVIGRGDGVPRKVDRRLWRELSRRLTGSTTALLDVAVVGPACWWSGAAARTYPLRNDKAHPALPGLDIEDDPVGGDVGEVRLVRDEDPSPEELDAGGGVPRHR